MDELDLGQRDFGLDLIDSWIEWYVLYARLKGGRSIIGAGNDIWIGERERITHGIWFRSCWSVTLPILLWAALLFRRFIYGEEIVNF